MDLNWPDKLEKFMITKEEQGQTPITSANGFLRMLATHKPEVTEHASNNNFLQADVSKMPLRSYSMQGDFQNSLVVKYRQQTVPVHVENCDEDRVDREKIYMPSKHFDDPFQDIEERPDKNEINDFGAPLTQNLDERL